MATAELRQLTIIVTGLLCGCLTAAGLHGMMLA